MAGISYEQVAQAADGLLAQGETPTLRAIRTELQGGSMGTLQKHLARWKAARHRTQAATPFAVDAMDVANLSPRDFVMLINHLVRREARSASIMSSPDITVQINTADDGVDGAIRWTGGPERTTHLPSRSVVWQAKSGRLPSPSELIREVQRRDNSALKGSIAEHFRSGGSYVLLTAADMTPLQKTVRLEAMTEIIRQHLPQQTPLLSIIAGAEIAAWASEDLWARAVLIKAAGREHLPTLMTFSDWRESPHLSNPYVWCPTRSAIAQNLRQAIQTPSKLYRVDGAPGLGKTRLVMEALRPLTDQGDSIVYFNASHSNSEYELLKALASWSQAGVTGILVVDNCALTLHQEIARQLNRLPMNVVTIGDRHDSDADATLYPLDNQTIDKIVEQHPLRPPQHAAVSRIVGYAEGWPIVALAVLQAIRNGFEHISELRDDALTRRLLGDPEPDALRVLKLLALFDHVGYRDTVSYQWEMLRKQFTPDISHDQFFAIVRRFRRQAVVAQIGRYWRLSPSPLAIRLAREWLEDASPEAQERLFLRLDDPLLQSLAQRFSEITTPSSVELARSMLEQDGPFGNVVNVISNGSGRIFRAFADVNPDGAAAAIRRTLLHVSDSQSKELNESADHYELVFTLERLAFHATHFKTAAKGLYLLARTERPGYSNNARGTLEKLFQIQGAQTQASPAARLALLDEINNNNEVSDRLVAGCLKAILESNPPFIRLGVESQGGRRPMDEWKPELWSEIFDYCREALRRAVDLSRHSDSSRELAKDVIAESFPTLMRFRLWDEMESAVDLIGPCSWPKAVERIKWCIRALTRDDQPAGRSRLEAILTKLMPSDLPDQVHLLITKAPHELVQRDGRHIDVSVENVQAFAKGVTSRGDAVAVLRLLSTGTHRLAHVFGQFAAEEAPDIAALVNDAVEAYKNAPDPRCDLPLLGISVGLVNRGLQDTRADFLTRLSTDVSLIDALPTVAAVPFIDDHGARLLVQYAKTATAKAPRPNLFLGQSCGRLTDSTICDMTAVFRDRGWYAAAFEALLFSGRTSEAIDSALADIVIASNFIAKGGLPDIHEWSVFDAIHRIVRSGNEQFALLIAKDMMSISPTASYTQRARVSGLWPDLIVYPAVFSALRATYSALDRRQRWQLLIGTKYQPEGQVEHALALEALPLDLLMDFAREFPDDVPWFLAENGTLVGSADEELHATALVEALLENFGDRNDVLSHIEANLYSFLSVGPREPYFNQRSRLIESLPTFNLVKLASWKEDLRRSFEAERQRTQLTDAEFEHGIF